MTTSLLSLLMKRSSGKMKYVNIFWPLLITSMIVFPNIVGKWGAVVYFNFISELVKNFAG